MIVNTRRLFARLLSSLKISDICDVGSMDGSDALFFRAAAPQATIYAFEPSPANLRRMEANPTLRERNIQVVPMAATNHEGEAEFFIVAADHSRRDCRRGMSSLYRRSSQWAVTSAVVPVRTTRLDTFLADKCSSHARLALWIDVEGKAYEVVEGLSGIARRVWLLNIEVENSPCIGANQRLYSEVKALLHRLGFREAATDQPPANLQFNALFVRTDLPASMRIRVRGWLLHARLRYLIVHAICKICPACAARYLAFRAR
jgi:FkbM family methyltransferase